MLNHATAQIFVCLDPVDMRKSFDTLDWSHFRGQSVKDFRIRKL